MNRSTLRIAEPRELLAFLPYQLGFQPEESAVVVSLRGPRSRVGLVARVDLADLAAENGEALSRMLLGHLVRDGARRCVLVLYTAVDLQGPLRQTDPGDVGPVPGAVGTASGRAGSASGGGGTGSALGSCGHERGRGSVRAAAASVRAAVATFCRVVEPMLGDVIQWVVGPAGYYAPGCGDRSCCPEGGRPLGELESTVVGAEMVLAGVHVLENRAELGRIPRAAGSERRKAFRAADRATAAAARAATAEELIRWRTAALTTWREEVARAVDSPGRWACPPARCGRLLAALTDVRVRDAVLLTLVPGAGRASEDCVGGATTAQVRSAMRPVFDPVDGRRPERDLAAAGRLVLEQVVAHGREGRCAAPLTLLALLAWWEGDGARANALLERALSADPDHRLGQLLAEVLAAGLAPGWARRSAAESRSAVDRSASSGDG